jgi:hypothetical protein
MKKTISTIMVLSMMFLGVSFDMYAKGSSSSGGRSSSSSSGSRSSSSRPSSGFSSGSSKPSSGFSSSSSSTPKPGGSGFSSGTPTKPSSGFSTSSTGTGTSKASSNAINNYNSSKTVAPVKSKTDFMADFRKTNEAKYPNTFTSQPTSRPTYIPSTTKVGSTSYNVDWNPTTRSYGYYSGTMFVPYDPVMVIGSSAYNSYASSPPVVVHSSGPGFFTIFLVLGGIVFVIVIIAIATR